MGRFQNTIIPCCSFIYASARRRSHPQFPDSFRLLSLQPTKLGIFLLNRWKASLLRVGILSCVVLKALLGLSCLTSSLWLIDNFIEGSDSPELAQIRQTVFLRSELVVICFAVNDPESFQRVKSHYAPEIRNLNPTLPIVVCATKVELRDDAIAIAALADQKLACISHQQGHYLADEIGAVKYCECSAKGGVGLATLARDLLDVCLALQQHTNNGGSNQKCLTM